MRLLSLLVCLAALTFSTAACKKKKSTKTPEGGNTANAMATMGPGTPAGMNGAMGPVRRAAPKGLTTAVAACPKGARPGADLTEKQFTLSVKAPAAGKVGAALTAELLVLPKAGFKVNLKYPTEFAVKQTSPGVAIAKKQFDKAQMTELTIAKLRLAVPYTPKTAGKKVVKGLIDFSVCTPKLCVTKEACVAWESAAQ